MEDQKQPDQKKQQRKEPKPKPVEGDPAGAGKKLTPEEKKAQREAVNAAKAAKKAEAAAKKQAKLLEDAKAAAADDDADEPSDKKKKKGKPNTEDSAAPAENPAQPTKQDSEPPLKKSNTMMSTMTDSLSVPTQSTTVPARARKMSILEEKNVFAHPGEKLTANHLSQKNINPSKMVKYLYFQDQPQTDYMHPAMHEIGLKLITDKLVGTNQTTLAILVAIKEVVNSFQQSKKNIIYHQELLQMLSERIIPFLERCRRLFAGTSYALNHLKQQVGQLSKSCKNLEELKESMIESIEDFIANKITFAQDLLIKNGLSILSDKKEEVILVYGNQESLTIENMLSVAHSSDKKFRVVVVDSAPDFHGRCLVKRLAQKGIKCQYTLINMVAFLIKTVTKVLLAATYVLCNGALVAPIGTSQIGCIAQQNQIPVVVVCETYKFADRVNLDQINNNEQGSVQKFKSNYLRGEQKGPSKLEVQLINLRYDLTPLKYLSMIVCEIGNIPPHSVPVVIREIMDYEDQHSDEELLSDDEDESSDNLSSEMKEQDEQDEEDEEPLSKQESDKKKRMADRMKNIEME